jgi:type II secretory pathway component GspD/PulD (secretin)
LAAFAVVLAAWTAGALAQDEKARQAGQPAASNGPAKATAAVTFFPVGERLLVFSDDPATTELVHAMIRALIQSQSKEPQFFVVKLRVANAPSAAQILDEVYNGRRDQGGFQRGVTAAGAGGRGGVSPFPEPAPVPGGGRGDFAATPASAPRPDRIRVVPNAANNTLLIWATPQDMTSIRRLLDTSIDRVGKDSEAIVRTWVLPPLQYANVTEVADVLRQVFPVAMSTGTGRAGPDNLDTSALGTNQASGIRGVQLTLGVDERTNTLVLACSQTMKEQVKEVVDYMENAAMFASRTVRVVSVPGIDPTLIQQAVEAMQGRPASASLSNSWGSMPGLAGASPAGTGQ